MTTAETVFKCKKQFKVMVTRNKFYIILLLCLPWHTTVNAQGNAGQAGEFLRWGVGAKALGLGRAFTSIADDASSIYWNPAGMTALAQNGATLMFMHLPIGQDASMNYLGGALPVRLFFVNRPGGKFVRALQDLKLGVGVIWQSLGEFDFYDGNAAPLSSTAKNTIGESAILLAASYPLNPLLRKLTRDQGRWLSPFKGSLELGFTTKFLKQNLFGEHGSATSLDLGLKYSHASGVFNLGFVWHDFNSPVFSYDSDLVVDEVPAHGTLGASLTPPFSPMRGLTLSFDYGILSAANREREIMFGFEYDFSKLSAGYPIKLRIGSNSTHESFTFGLNFSPEELFEQDWLPSGDWTYANDRSNYNAVGQRYSFSLDRNPFTAKYWYLNGLAQLEESITGAATDRVESERVLHYMKNAEQAKNPGSHPYRYQAALRVADVKFFIELAALRTALPVESDRQSPFIRVTENYIKRATKYQRLDYGKTNLDFDSYFRSYVYYLQALILSGETELARQMCTSGSAFAGQKLSSLKQQQRDHLNYLLAYASFGSELNKEATKILQERLAHSSVGKFLLAHIQFMQGNYRDVLRNVEQIDLNDTEFPHDLYLPITNDYTFGDEVLFLKAISIYELSSGTEKGRTFINEFAKIPRYFPASDLAQFLIQDDAILSALIEQHEAGNPQEMDKLVRKIVMSYVKTFSNGTLLKNFYTYNYK